MLRVLEDFATDQEYDAVVRTVCNDQFAWYYPQVGRWNEPDPRKACFGRVLLGKQLEDWSSAPVLKHIFERWSNTTPGVEVHKLTRCRINLYTPGQLTSLHQDSTDANTYSLLWYFSESDGGTQIEHEWIQHVPNRAVVFDSRLWHEPTPSQAPARITVNWIFQGTVQ
jgi:hypothetical protein